MKEQAKITSKGQVTIPKEVRDRLGVGPGDRLEFVADRAGYRVCKRAGPSPFEKYVGFLKELAGADPDALVEAARGR